MSHQEELQTEEVQGKNEGTEETRSVELTDKDLQNVAGVATDHIPAIPDDIRES